MVPEVMALKPQVYEIVYMHNAPNPLYRRDSQGRWEFEYYGDWLPVVCNSAPLEAAYQAYLQEHAS